LESLTSTARPADTATARVTGAAPWARAFAVDLDEVDLPPAAAAPAERGTWQLFTTDDHPAAAALRQALHDAHLGTGVLVCLPPQAQPEHLALALAGARQALTQPAGGRFVLVQHGRGAAGLAKTVHLEAPHLRVTVVDAPAGDQLAEQVVAEVAATTRFTHAHYDVDGTRRVPTLRALPYAPRRTEQILTRDDVLLVTGGGKGITAECALAVSRHTGAKLAVLGRSDPATDDALAENLRRMRASGVRLAYARADVTDAARVAQAVSELSAELGPVTAVLHGAGRNEPTALTGLTMDDVECTLAPKTGGLQAVLDAVGEDSLKLLVTFGSIIGRAGLRGEAHYATANEWLADLTEDFARRRPGCRTRCLEWSVWSGVGMGEQLAVVESLTREGITPLTPDQGVAVLLRLIGDPDAPVVTVVSGRTEGIETIRRDLPPLPLLRFIGTPLIRYHDVELVTQVELNPGTDPYLLDHHLDGNLLLPAVLGMEAMTQVAHALTAADTAPVLEDVTFLRPIVVPPGGATHIQIAATVTGPGTVDVAIHAEETDFAAEHFRARLVYHDSDPEPCAGPPGQVPDTVPAAPLDPQADLYGQVLFQGTRFQRLRRFHKAAARHVDAEVAVGPTGGWFAPFLPSTLLLADPGMRDALMHGNQVCVPDATLLPSGIERLIPLAASRPAPERLRYCATERTRDGDTYVYDIAVRTHDGTVVERWEGLTLHAVRKSDGCGPWVPPLLGPYLERALEDILDTHLDVAVEPYDATTHNRRASTATALKRAIGAPAEIRYRPDGRPELTGGPHMSAAHGPGVTLAVAAPRTVACDVEAVDGRTAAQWDHLLGERADLARLVARETGETQDTAATRVWSAAECLVKAQLAPHTPLTVEPSPRPHWVVFTAGGGARIATFVTALRHTPQPVVFAFLATPASGSRD
jgi:enediyne polyketide synthase